jgi:hypothetical protein
MTDKPKIKVLTRLKINEISLVDRGAGENCRILISKRDDSADADRGDPSPAEITRAKVEGYTALRHAEERFLKEHGTGHADHAPEDDPSRFLFSKETFVRKSAAADARGDGDGDGNSHHASQIADLLVESGKHPDRQAALDHLLHNPRGAAMLQRLSKSEDSTPMPVNFSDVVKSHGIALFKHMVSEGTSFGLSEEDVVKLATEHAQRVHSGDRGDVAFAKMFSATDEAGATLRAAVEVAKNASLQDAVAAEVERDSREAMEELSKIGKARWPNLTPAQRFARAFETNPELAKRAHRRPGPSTSFAHPAPVAKDLAAPVVDPKPIFVGDDVALDVDDPRKAVEQLKEQGRSRWPSASALEQFERALTDPENSELVRRAFATPTGSSPPRR